MAFPRISRTIDEIRGSIYGHLDSVQEDLAAAGWLPARLNLNKGIVRGLIELFAWGVWQIYALLEKLLRQAVPYYSSEKWLDLHAESVGLERKAATKAKGKTRFYRALDSSGSSTLTAGSKGNIPVPLGRIVRTLPDGAGQIYRYVTTESAVLSAGEDFVEVVVESEEYGSSANVGVGQICELVTPVTGIAAVSNGGDWLISEGADTETDEQLIQRIRLRWMGNNGCTKYAYKAWALSVPGVISVEILDRHPRGQGTVGVVVRGSAVLPTEALLERVREAIAPEAPINDDWFVVSPDPVAVNIQGRLHYVTGDPEILKTEAAGRIQSLFADESLYPNITPLKIGQDLPLDLLTAAVMDVPGVKSVEWLGPTGDLAGDVIVPKTGMALLESLNFSAFQEEEE